MKNAKYTMPLREEGFIGLGDYAAIGEGRSVALIAPDGSIDWWSAPNLDSPPLFDRLLDPKIGGFFSLTPALTIPSRAPTARTATYWKPALRQMTARYC